MADEERLRKLAEKRMKVRVAREKKERNKVLTDAYCSSFQFIVFAGINGEELFALLKKYRLVHAVLAIFGGKDEQRDVPASRGGAQ